MESNLKDVKYNSHGLVPVIAQDHKTGEVLMMAYMNEEAVEKTIETGKMHYFSRSRQKLWLKGETSGHFQNVKSIRIDCDNDSLLAMVEQVEAACHTGHYSCFYRELQEGGLNEFSKKVFDETLVYGDKSKILKEVYNVILDRKKNPKEGSYTNYLFDKGVDKILKKVGEETSEVIIAAKNDSKDEMRYEIADLFYHLFVLMVDKNLSLDDIYEELTKRR